ncbi:alpha/beta fold hydrolase [Agilicoccus flavus]|uniref:alpha/beta fold hydrolase n=1 Tax=Agilicoccus flavus TaxID=2775968 RepID=UPI001CF6BA51|nr:alpha/beta hydrolase [Agilicoccus flavus]
MSTSPPAEYVLFVHGVGGSPLTWEHQVSRLPADLPARAPWLRGLRPGGAEEFDVRDAAGDLATALQLEGVSRAALVGHALGGLVAVQTAIDHPELVSHLVLLGTQPAASRGGRRLQRWALALVPKRRFSDAGVDKAKVRDALRAGGPLDASTRFGDVRAPTFVVVGSRARADVAAGRLLASAIPDAHLEIVDGAGHDVMSERPDEVNALVYGFLGHGA